MTEVEGVIEDVLSHHGIKGMRWGVRRANIGTGREKVVSEDAAKAKGAKKKLKKQGKDSLTNEELQSLLTRMDLETRISRTGITDSKYKKATKFTNDVMNKPEGKLAIKAATELAKNKKVRRAVANVAASAAIKVGSAAIR